MDTILIPQDITEAGKRFLQGQGYEIRITGRIELEELCQDAADCDAILARTCPYPAEIFRHAPRLKCIARHGSGYDNVDVTAATEAGVYVCNTPTAPANAVAEHTMLLLLACARRLPLLDSQTRRGNWGIRNERKQELAGKTLGVMGFGEIGQRVARKAHFGFDMQVLAYSRHTPRDEAYRQYARHTTDFDAVLRQADFLTVHLPATPETRGMFRRDSFARMKPGSIFINTSRGELVEEQALLEALRSGPLSMAGLDVFSEEPLPSDSPLLRLDNLIVTPHCASLTRETMDQMGLLAAQEIDRVLRGEPPKWPVNQPKSKQS